MANHLLTHVSDINTREESNSHVSVSEEKSHVSDTREEVVILPPPLLHVSEPETYWKVENCRTKEIFTFTEHKKLHQFLMESHDSDQLIPSGIKYRKTA